MKTLRILGFALVAALGISAVVASAASAAIEFKAAAAPVTLTGTQKPGTSNVFTTMGGNVTCTTITYEGVMEAVTSREIELEPTYGGCSAFGFINVPIDVNGCKYKFTSQPAVNEAAIHIICPAGKSIEVTAPGCSVTVGTQTPTAGSLTYTNLNAKSEIGIALALSGIHYIEDNRGAFPTCINAGVTTADGTYRGETIVKGENGGVKVNIWIE